MRAESNIQTEAAPGRTFAITGTRVVERPDGIPLALFESPYWVERLAGDHPGWLLEPILTGQR